MDDVAEVASLAEGLDATARRRLWLVWRITQHCHASELNAALEGLMKLDEFIVSGRRPDSAGVAHSGNENAEAASADGANGYPGQLVSAAAAAAHPPKSQSAGTEGKNGRPQRSLLDCEARSRFIAEAVRNPDNRHLAQVFGLTVRQAHAIRVALSKLIVQARREQGVSVPQLTPRAVRRSAPHAPSLDRDEELKLQEEFLRARPPPPTSVEDIVRYLRQKGDVVFSDGDRFVLNYRLKLTPAQLVDRANAKRRESSQQPFVVEQPSHNEVAVVANVRLEAGDAEVPCPV